MSLAELHQFVREMNLQDSISVAVPANEANDLAPQIQGHHFTDPAGTTRQLSTLCQACQSLFQDTSSRRTAQFPHYGVDGLRAQAGQGCQLCLTVYHSMDPDLLVKFQKTVVQSQGIASFTPISRDQARIQFRYLSATGEDRGSVDSSNSAQKRPQTTGPGQSTTSVNSVRSQSEQVSLLSVDLILVKPEFAESQKAKFIDGAAGRTDSYASMEVAAQWLSDCTLKHMKCSVAEPLLWKPKRLLDISVRGPGGTQGVKLTDGMFADPLSEYVTLSYCYGTSKQIRLHRKTLPALRQGVAASSLPKTLEDAVYMTRKLGFRYLWVDCICLMQDDPDEMLSECSQMDKVYSGASLNLTATASRDSAGGLFYKRDVDALRPCIIEVTGNDIVPGTYYCLRSTIWQDLVDRSPIARRAWILQERCLAKRTLHFTRNEILWECQECSASESFPDGLAPALGASEKVASVLSFNKKMHHRGTRNWNELVRLYTQGGLTYRSDKLIAMEGMVQQYATKNRLREKDYVAGLWRQEMPHALLWHVQKGLRPMKYRAPSWTWTSIDGSIQYPPPTQTSKDTCVEVLDISLKHKNKQDPFGLVESGILKLRGFLVKGFLDRSKEHWDRTTCTIKGFLSEFTIGSAVFDERLPRLGDNAPEEIYCLPVIETVDRMEGLLLRAMDEIGQGMFRRLGAFQISRWDQISWDRFKENMKGDPTLDNYEHRLDHTNAYWFASDYTYTINIV